MEACRALSRTVSFVKFPDDPNKVPSIEALDAINGNVILREVGLIWQSLVLSSLTANVEEFSVSEEDRIGLVRSLYKKWGVAQNMEAAANTSMPHAIHLGLCPCPP